MNDDQLKRVRKVVMEDSARNNLLQLADYIVGIIHRDHDENKTMKIDYMGMIKHKGIETIIRPQK